MKLPALLAALFLTVPAYAAEMPYMGSWKFTEAEVAPWMPAGQQADPSEKARLVGQTLTLKKDAITGPEPFACEQPNYQIEDSSADMLFEGAFGEMHAEDNSIDPVKEANLVGLPGNAWKTLDTGCDIDFHFADPKTAKIGLNYYVFTLKKI